MSDTEYQQHDPVEESLEDSTPRSETRPPEDDGNEGQVNNRNNAVYDDEEGEEAAAPAEAPHDVHVDLHDAQAAAAANSSSSGHHYCSSQQRRGISGGGGGGTPRTPRSASRTRSQQQQQQGSVPRRSMSLCSTPQDARNITKENHNSLVADPHLQDLRREGVLSASRYRSARRASGYTGNMGIGGADYGSVARSNGGGSRRGSSVGSRRGSGAAPLSENEAFALDVMAANDDRRIETYERAQEVDAERQCYVIDQQLDREIKAEHNHVRLINGREEAMLKKQQERERRQAEAWKRRCAADEERRRALEAKIAASDRAAPRDPYGPMAASRRYSQLGAGGGGLRRGTTGSIIAPQRSNGNNADNGDRNDE